MRRRKPKTVTCLRLAVPLPSCLISASHRGSRTVLLGLLLSTLCLGQAAGDASAGEKKHEKPYSLIFGTVWGPDNRPLYAVKVKIRRAQDKKARWELYSDHNGEFAQRLPPGPADYLVWADLKGHKPPVGKQLQPGPEVRVHIDADERADIGLHLK
jgi:hypothetical protein